MKIAILGSSVSKQTRHHESKAVTGYVQVLRDTYQAGMGISEIRQITYAGNRLSDGGLARLTEVLAYAPDICIFEPLIEDSRRGTLATEAELNMVYRRLLNAGILPVTLLLPNPKLRQASRSTEYNKLTRICSTLELPVVDISIPEDIDLVAGFNGVHTRAPGAAFYARTLHKALLPCLDPHWRQAVVAKAGAKARTLPKEAFLRRLGCPGGMPPKTRGVVLDLTLGPTSKHNQNGRKPGQGTVRLVQEHMIGTFSPVIQTRAVVQDTGALADNIRTSVWDDYCHFDRDSFVTSGDLSLAVNTTYQITLSMIDEDPDYASCRRAKTDWPAASARYLHPLGPLFVISDTAFTAQVQRYDPAL